MTERLARFCTRRPWLTVAVWIVALVVFIGVAGQFLASGSTTEFRLGSSQPSTQAAERLTQFGSDTPVEVVVVKSASGATVDDPAFAAKVEALAAEIEALGPEIIARADTYYRIAAIAQQTGDAALVGQAALMLSADRTSTLLFIRFAGDKESALDHIEDMLHIVEEARGDPAFDVRQIGVTSINYENNEIAVHDLEQGERVGIPVALLVLLLLFGSVVAALIPIIVAVICILITLGVVAVIGQFHQVVVFAQLGATMIGLAVGIDYALLIISRYREEINSGKEKIEAIARAGGTAGRTVLFSGVTVVIALSGMFVIPFNFYQTQALAMIIVVTLTIVAMLTLLPAVLAILGGKVNALRIPIVGRSIERVSADQEEGGFWNTATRIVMRFPVISLLLVGVPMVALAVLYVTTNETGLAGTDQAPEGSNQRLAFELIEQEFPAGLGLIAPIDVVLEGDVNSPEGQAAIQRIVAAIQADSRFPAPPLLNPSPNGASMLLSVSIPGSVTSRENIDTLIDLRDRVIPEAVDGANVQAYIGGNMAEGADVIHVVNTYQPYVFAFVLAFSFVVLMVVFRSIVIPIKAVFMNLLSVGATYGILVLVFQQGWLIDILGFQRADTIEAWLPLFLFSILFGLSMDYHVFMLSRIKERYDHTGDNREAVAYGLRSTASLITGAALIMVAVFGAFASGQSLNNQMLGFGLAVAILLDATLVRSVLVPASMELLGKGNWYLPPFLNWLPRIDVEGESH